MFGASVFGAAEFGGELVFPAWLVPVLATGKYRPEHDSALADLLGARDFAAEHASAYADLMEA